MAKGLTTTINPRLTAALKYEALGFSVIPVSKSKIPLVSWKRYQTKRPSRAQIKNWWSKYPDANIGLITGPISGILVLDFDSRKAIKAFKDKFPHLPYSIAQNTSRGRHYFFKYPENKQIPCSTGLFRDVDLKADGGLIVISPSVHENGDKYKWLKGKNLLKLGRRALPELPAVFIDSVLLNFKTGYAEESEKYRSKIFMNVPEGERNDTMFRYLCSLLSKGLTKDEVSVMASSINEHWEKPLSQKEVAKLINNAVKYKDTDQGSPNAVSVPIKPPILPVPKGISAQKLLRTNIPEPKWAINGFLCEGLNFLAGKPKAGKSIMALNLGVAIAYGIQALDRFDTELGTVIYLALEDTKRRLQKRLEAMVPGLYGSATDKLLLFTEWPRMGQGGLSYLRTEMDKHKDLRMVIIDTFQCFRNANSIKSSNIYAQDYEHAKRLKTLADEFGISIVVVHHFRKTVSEDVFEMFSGSTGLTGAADGLIALSKNNLTGTLNITGRDIEEKKYAVELEPVWLTWKVIGYANERKSTSKQQALLDIIRNWEGTITPKDLREKTGYTEIYVNKTLKSFLRSGNIMKVDWGRYKYNRI